MLNNKLTILAIRNLQTTMAQLLARLEHPDKSGGSA
jgi:hypothetical protein